MVSQYLVTSLNMLWRATSTARYLVMHCWRLGFPLHVCGQDVLPLFPDFVRIDAFKGALCDGLADYNAQITALKAEMEDATRIADALRCLTLKHTSHCCYCPDALRPPRSTPK